MKKQVNTILFFICTNQIPEQKKKKKTKLQTNKRDRNSEPTDKEELEKQCCTTLEENGKESKGESHCNRLKLLHCFLFWPFLCCQTEHDANKRWKNKNISFCYAFMRTNHQNKKAKTNKRSWKSEPTDREEEASKKMEKKSEWENGVVIGKWIGQLW